MKSSGARWAVVFDFDGTLADSQHALLITTNHLLAEEHRRPLTMHEMRPMLGGGAKRLADLAFRLTGEPAVDPDELLTRWRAIYDAIAVQHTPLYPDVIPTLNALRERGVAMGVCTGKPREPTLMLLDALGIREHFTSVFGVDSTPTPKPHPGHLQAVLDDLGINGEFAVMVGDTNTDLELASAAGVASLLIMRETEAAAWSGDATWAVERLEELVPLFDRHISNAAHIDQL